MQAAKQLVRRPRRRIDYNYDRLIFSFQFVVLWLTTWAVDYELLVYVRNLGLRVF